MYQFVLIIKIISRLIYTDFFWYTFVFVDFLTYVCINNNWRLQLELPNIEYLKFQM